jgi:hypothetical protein
MREDSRVKRWQDTKRQHGLKAGMIWLTTEEELRLKKFALQWHCSPSTVVHRALAQVSPATLPQYSSHPDALLIRELILEELPAMQTKEDSVTGGPTDTHPAATLLPHPTPGQDNLTALQVTELRGKRAAGTPIKVLMAEYGLAKAMVFRYLKWGEAQEVGLL